MTFPKQVLLYVNQVYPDDLSGQGTFEREMIVALRDRVKREPGTALQVFTVRRSQGPQPEQPDVQPLVLDKHRQVSYLAHQVRLALALVKAIFGNRTSEVTVLARYQVSSIAIPLLSTLFRRRLVIRTGPDPALMRRYGKRPNPVVELAIRLSFWWNCRKSSSIIVVTEQTRRFMERIYPFSRGKMVVIPNGASPERIPLCVRDRARWGLPEGGLALGFVGNFFPGQGLDTVIRALAKLQADTGDAPPLLVVGGGLCWTQWTALARDLGVDSKVVFAGPKLPAEVPSALAACDVMVAPYNKTVFATTGSSGMKLFEYLSADKPVLTSRGEDHKFLLDAGVGWLVDPEDVGAWAEAVRQIMDGPIPHLNGRGRQLIQERHSFRLLADRAWATCFPPRDAHMAADNMDVWRTPVGAKDKAYARR